MTDNRKTIVIIGITGNQGGSVAQTFLSDPSLRLTYRIRGISRDPSSAACHSLLAAGVEEIVQANLHNPASLSAAFSGASVIFSVTDFWHPFFDPANAAAAAQAGKSTGELVYELEYEQGRNVADAAASVATLERFVVSTLSSPRKTSNGDPRFAELWHYESKAAMTVYVREKHPGLAAKMSTLDMGVFYTSWRFVDLLMPRQMPGGGHKMVLPCNPDKPVPLVDARRDTGKFVAALLQVPPGVDLLGESTMISWSDYMRVWGSLMKVPKAEYEECSVESWEEALPGGFGKELADMFLFMGIHDWSPESIKKEELGVEIPGLMTLERFIRGEDWSLVGIPPEVDPTKG